MSCAHAEGVLGDGAAGVPPQQARVAVRAALGHAFADLVELAGTVAGSGLAPSMLIKAVVELFGLLAVWIIRRRRDQSVQPVSAVTVRQCRG